MHAEIVVRHRPLDGDTVARALRGVFGEHNPEGLRQSAVCRVYDDSRLELIVFCLISPRYILVCSPVLEDELHVSVEPTTTTAPRAANSAWRGVRRALRNLGARPTVDEANILEEPLGDVVLEGRTGLTSALSDAKTLAAAGIAVLYPAYLAVAANTFAEGEGGALLGGALPTLTAATAQLGVSSYGLVSKVIRWKAQ